MKVVLSIDPVKFPLTGIGRYTYELGSRLETLDFLSLRFLQGYKFLVSMPMASDGQAMGGGPAWKVWLKKSSLALEVFRRANSFFKASILKGLEDHIFHGPNYYLPPFGGTSVVTIHDLSPYLWADTHPFQRVKFMRAEIETSLKRAAALITDTQYTRQEVAEYFAWPLERVFAVPLASGPEFFPREVQDLTLPLASLGLQPGAYLLFIGTIEPRKNISTLLKAYGKLDLAKRKRWPLVVVGYKGWGSDDLHKELQRAESQGWLRYLGYLPQVVLPVLMAGARLFLYPSLYEGFGLPVLEAMASGVPVICSNASTLPEVAGQAAAMHDPYDVDTLSDLIAMGLEDELWRMQSSKIGLEQAKKFSWERCTMETVAVYKAVSSL